MAVNKVIYNTDTGEQVLIDLTGDTVTANDLKQGVKAHNAAGEIITGTLITQNYYIGTTEPDDSFGNDGDLYLKKV